MTVTAAGDAHEAELKARAAASQAAHAAERLERGLDNLQVGDLVYTTLRRGDVQRAGIVVEVGDPDIDTGEARQIRLVEVWPDHEPCELCGHAPTMRHKIGVVTDAQIAQVEPRTTSRLLGWHVKLLLAYLPDNRARQVAGDRRLLNYANELIRIADKEGA